MIYLILMARIQKYIDNLDTKKVNQLQNKKVIGIDPGINDLILVFY